MRILLRSRSLLCDRFLLHEQSSRWAATARVRLLSFICLRVLFVKCSDIALLMNFTPSNSLSSARRRLTSSSVQTTWLCTTFAFDAAMILKLAQAVRLRSMPAFAVWMRRPFARKGCDECVGQNRLRLELFVTHATLMKRRDNHRRVFFAPTGYVWIPG